MKTLNIGGKDFEIEDEVSELIISISKERDSLMKPRNKEMGISKDTGYGHLWGDCGERCIKCGDKDWMADAVCSVRDKID